MPLYRADYIGTDGKVTGSVKARDVGRFSPSTSGDLLTRHMQTIRPQASLAARRAECDVLITRIIGAGRMKGTLIATPDGGFRKPEGTRTTDRGGDHKDSGACFCAACRADRALKRAAIPREGGDRGGRFMRDADGD